MNLYRKYRDIDKYLKTKKCPICNGKGYMGLYENEYESHPRDRHVGIHCNICNSTIEGEGGSIDKAVKSCLRRWKRLLRDEK